MTGPYRSPSSLVASMLVFTVFLFLPWPDGNGPRLYQSVAGTVRTLNTTALTVLRNPASFQRNLRTPQSGEYVLPPRVQEILTILGGPGRGVKHFQISDPLAADEWTYQQIVASAWPHRLDGAAKARFVLNDDPLASSCGLVDRQREVSLVYCP